MFKLQFRTDNAAFQDDGGAMYEIERILRQVSGAVSHAATKGVIFDVNGNRIGSWSWTRGGEEG